MRLREHSLMYPLHMSAQVYPALQRRPSEFQSHRHNSSLQHSTEARRVPWANPQGTARHILRGVDFAAQLTCANSNRLEEPRQYRAPGSLIWYHVSSTWFILERAAKGQPEEFHLRHI